jgi:hypothetical protein
MKGDVMAKHKILPIELTVDELLLVSGGRVRLFRDGIVDGIGDVAVGTALLVADAVTGGQIPGLGSRARSTLAEANSDFNGRS